MSDVLITEAIAGPEIEQLGRRFDVAYEPHLWKSPEELVARIGPFGALLVRNQTRVDAGLIAAGGNLRVIARAGVGLDNVDVEAATKRGIVVCYAPEQNSVSVAELAIGLMIALSRRIPAADRSVRAGQWLRRQFTGEELFGKTLGIVGLGRIGFLTAMRARAFGMNIVAYDPVISPDSFMVSESRARLMGLHELLGEADIVSVHVPATPQTIGLFGLEQFAAMKRSALFINTARGDIVREEALIAALKDKSLAGAALDVRAKEPPVAGELEGMDNVILLPHIAAFTHEGQQRVTACVCRDITAVLDGRPAMNWRNFPCPKKA